MQIKQIFILQGTAIENNFCKGLLTDFRKSTRYIWAFTQGAKGLGATSFEEYLRWIKSHYIYLCIAPLRLARRRNAQHMWKIWGAFDSAKNHKRQYVTAKREKSQTPKFV